jgi:murein DD-endopeptidase MepM/ murein hydrolase activator NlpD
MTKYLISVLTLLAIGIGVAVPQEASRHSTTPRKPKEKLQTDLHGIKSKKHEVRAKLNQTKHKVHVVRGDINSLDMRLNRLEDQLDSTTNHLGESRKLQKVVNAELVDVSKRLAVKREEVRHRLKLIYVRGDAGVVAALGTSQSVGQFASRRYAFERIAHKDRQLFDEVKELQGQVQNRKKRADQLVREISGLKQNQEEQQSELQDTREEKGALLGQLKHKQRDLQRMVDELDAEENEIEAQIAAYDRKPGHKLPAFKGRFMRPVSGPITSGFGWRMHPVLHRRRLHSGMDIGARTGVAISAAADGVVITAHYSRGYGNMIVIDHGGGVSTLYGHCSRLFVSSGQRVKRGQKIGAVGSTGLTTGPHLHWEVRIRGKAVNPAGRF